ncbi:MAG: YkgJ family cysteine cluster protein [Thermodesulfovibrionales bacterium]|nr:YkgJ family cysteine cluster protein [Thermodesulfovibrionales bacterium]
MKNNAQKGKHEILTPQGYESNDRPQRMRLKKRMGCIRCGNCCTGGSPVLLKEDLSLFRSDMLSHENTYTIREGELLSSSDNSEAFESFIELIKVREKNDRRECIFYKGEGECMIYENRPVQCRAYKCWESDTAGQDILTGLENERLSRKDLFGSIDVMMDIINRHEEKCSYKRLSDALERLSQGDENAVEDIMDMLQYDTYARPFLKEKFNISENAMDLILGRPMVNTINAFGFKVEQEGDEYILLPIESIKEMKEGQ